MGAIRRVAVCLPQVPFHRGGAELAAEALVAELRLRDYEADLVTVPFRWTPKMTFLDQALAWRSLDLREANGLEIDRVIATKFPSYMVEHPNKVTWLFHQFRQVYDLFDTDLSEFKRTPDDLAVREAIRRMDCHTLAESRALYTLSQTVSKRLADFNGLESEPLYCPPRRHDEFRCEGPGDYVLSVGRLDRAKRVDRLIEALPHTDAELRCVIAGEGPEREALERRALELGVDERVDFAGAVPFERLVDLYAHSLAVYFAPVMEDYGLVTLEAFLSGKPVVTAPDAGGVLEFVRDGDTGVVSELDAEKLGQTLRALAAAPRKAAEMGDAARQSIAHIGWDAVVEALVAQ